MPEQADADFFQIFCEKLTHNHWAAVVDLPENTLLLTPFQDKVLAIVLTKMNITLALKNAQLQSTLNGESDVSSVSQKYNKEGELTFDDRILNGFYDPGRVEPFLSLEEYSLQPFHEGREVLLLDSSKDCKLVSYVQRSEELLSNFADMQSQARVLALFVSNCFGGDFPSSCASAAQINQVKASKQSNVVLIGEVTSGVCRHRAILYKYLCDRFGIPCELKRGTYHVDTENSGAHAWNVIRLGMQYFVVDIMHEPTQLHNIDSDKAKNYTQDTPSLGKRNWIPVVRPELSHRRFLRLPNLREKAVFHERLGRGNSTVYRITLGGLSCALKKIDIGKMSEQQRQYAIQEVSIMEMLQHENIIHYLGHELLEDKKELHILMELFPLSLGQLIDRRRKQGKKFRIQEIKHLAIEILNGIDYLHNQKIIHRDLKPDNILVDLDENDQVNKVKITDFGVSKILTDNTNTDQTRVGTELYMAPEQSDPKLPSCRIDIWSFGIILLELLTLQPAYHDFQKEVAVEMIKQGIPPKMPEKLSCDENRIVEIIKSCLRKEPQNRPSAEQLVLSFFRLQCYNS